MAGKHKFHPHLALREASWRPMLMGIPRHNLATREFREANGMLVLSVPLLRPWWQVPPITWVITISKTRNIRLDEMGTLLWDLCDGTRSVEEVIEAFGARYLLTFLEARLSVTEHIKQLMQRGALGMEQRILTKEQQCAHEMD